MRSAIPIVLLITIATRLATAETAWEIYLNLPTPDHASKVQDVEYSPDTRGAKLGYEYLDLMLLNQQVHSGDAEAMRLAIRVAGSTKAAATSEYLGSFVSAAIRGNPNLFLSAALQEQLSEKEIRGYLIGGAEFYVDRFAAQNYELEERLNSISRVSDPALSEIQERSKTIIRKELKWRSKAH